MATKKELKLKAKINDLEAMRGKVKEIGEFLVKERFVDYFFKSEKLENISELRLRKLDGDRIVKLKILLSKDKIQQNAEYEFKVDNADDFVEFLEHIGINPSTLLHKESELYKYEDATIELTNVEGLGDYVELVMYSKDELIEENKKKLIDLASKLGIGEEEIDSRYYRAIKEEKE